MLCWFQGRYFFSNMFPENWWQVQINFPFWVLAPFSGSKKSWNFVGDVHLPKHYGLIYLLFFHFNIPHRKKATHVSFQQKVWSFFVPPEFVPRKRWEKNPQPSQRFNLRLDPRIQSKLCVRWRWEEWCFPIPRHSTYGICIPVYLPGSSFRGVE